MVVISAGQLALMWYKDSSNSSKQISLDETILDQVQKSANHQAEKAGGDQCTNAVQ